LNCTNLKWKASTGTLRVGFPVDPALLDRIGSPGFPKDPHDLRGEIVLVEVAGKRSSFALDYSDYMLISPRIREQTDLIFKCILSPEEDDPKIIPMGYFPANPRLLAVARRLELRRPASRKGWNGVPWLSPAASAGCAPMRRIYRS
jgi:hypothetical protein